MSLNPVQSIESPVSPSIRLMDGCHLTPLHTIREVFKLPTSRQAALILKSLKIPILYIGNEAYYNLYMLDKVLYYASRMGGEGFAAPGTVEKQKGRSMAMFQINDEDMAIINSLDFTIEWLTMSYFRLSGRPGKLKAIVKQATSSLRKGAS